MRESKSYKELRLVWYQILKDNEFVDIETKNGNLLPDVDPRTKQRALLDREEREYYYHEASSYLFEGEFDIERNRIIWELHADGYSLREIAFKLSMGKTSIAYIINKLKSKAGLK